MNCRDRRSCKSSSAVRRCSIRNCGLPDSLLLETAREIGARRIFVDGIGLLADRGANNTVRVEYRELLQKLIESLNRENLTAMLSLEVGRQLDSVATMETSDFLADTVIQLGRERWTGVAIASLEVVKSRGQDFDQGQHTLRITGGKGSRGISVAFRRPLAPLGCNATSSNKRSVIGVDAVDSLIGGGVFDGSTTMVIGVSGVGKTGAQHADAARRSRCGKKNQGFDDFLDEHPAQIIRNAQTLGLDLQEQIDDGTIKIMFESPQELDIDAHYARIVGLVEET